jgi:flagellar hook-associated protein 1 FlgK
MSINSIISTASSGLQAAQSGLRVTSDNIANVNTPGYVRKTLQQTSRVSNGVGAGVDVAGVTRAANSYLQLSSMTASTAAGRAGVRSELLDNAQTLFGNPSTDSSYFNRLDELLSAFSQASDDPSSNLRRTQATAAIQDFLSASAGISNSLSDIASNADTRINASVARANDLLQQLEKLNVEITAQKSSGGDTTGSENLQSGMLDELSSLMDITVSDRQNGGIMVRSPSGQLLAGAGAATISYERSDGGDSFLQVTVPGGSNVKTGLQVSGGEIGGLMSLRNSEIPGIGEQLGEYVSKAVDEINRAANAASAVPAPTSLTGRNTGLDSATAVKDFTGLTTVAILSASGVLQHRVDIDFDAGTMALDGGSAVSFNDSNFVTTLNTTLGTYGDASFSGGQLTIAAQTAGSGVAVQDDPADPALKAGKGFSHFFGLNDLMRSTQPSDPATGMTPTSLHGFTPGDTITLRITDSTGARQRDITVEIPPAPTAPAQPDMAQLLNSLNSPTTGVGLYGAFNLSSSGELTFAARAGSDYHMSIASDGTSRGSGGPSITQLFGLGQEQRSNRGAAYAINPAITADPAKLPFGVLDLTVVTGESSLVSGDGRGALALSKAGDATTAFAAAGTSAAINTSLSRYASLMSGQIGRAAASADDALTSAESVKTEADARRQSVEGVNLDEELINLTTYQQAFNASARLIQASKDLYDALLGMI